MTIWTPRAYQERACSDVLKLWVFNRCVLLVMPTGGGKTRCAVSLMGSGNAIFVAHRKELIDQAHKALLRDGVPESELGVIKAGDERRNPKARIQVCSIDTLRNRTLPPAERVIIDEAHRSAAKTYRWLLEQYPTSKVLGLTATPYRIDGQGLGDIFDVMVQAARPSELIAGGFIDDPIIYSAPSSALPSLDKVRSTGGDYNERDLDSACNQTGLVGAIVEHWKTKAEGRRSVCFATTIEHSRNIANQFRSSGVSAEHLDGDTPQDEREAILGRLEKGATQVVTNCNVLSEGWDQPSAKCCILARPTKSVGLFLQQVGRFLRPWEDVRPLILDHARNVSEHGFPQEDREYDLHQTKEKKGKKAPPMKVCPNCYRYWHAAVLQCKECGYVWEREDKTTVDETVELQLVVPHADKQKREHYIWLRDKAERAGFKPGWAAHQFKAKYGHWPALVWTDTPEQRAARYNDYIDDMILKGYKSKYADTKFHAVYGEWPTEEVKMRASLLRKAAQG